MNYEAVNYVDYANYEADSGKTNMENVCLTKDISLVSNIIGLTGKLRAAEMEISTAL